MTNEKRNFRVNLVDILLTVVIAGVIAVGAIMIANAFGVDAAKKEDMKIEYTIIFRGMMPELCDNVAVGEKVIDAQKRLDLGTVTRVRTTPYTKDVYDEQIEAMVEATHPEYLTLYITVESPGYVSEEWYYINGIKMAVGNGISIHMKDLCATGYINDMRIK